MNRCFLPLLLIPLLITSNAHALYLPEQLREQLFHLIITHREKLPENLDITRSQLSHIHELSPQASVVLPVFMQVLHEFEKVVRSSSIEASQKSEVITSISNVADKLNSGHFKDGHFGLYESDLFNLLMPLLSSKSRIHVAISTYKECFSEAKHSDILAQVDLLKKSLVLKPEAATECTVTNRDFKFYLENYFVPNNLPLSRLKNGIMLDVGCGEGAAVIEAEKLGLKVFGLDRKIGDDKSKILKGEISKLDHLPQNKLFIEADFFESDLPKNYFDTVSSVYSIFHYNPPNTEHGFKLTEFALKKIHEILKPGGIVLIAEYSDSLLKGITAEIAKSCKFKVLPSQNDVLVLQALGK